MAGLLDSTLFIDAISDKGRSKSAARWLDRATGSVFSALYTEIAGWGPTSADASAHPRIRRAAAAGALR
jgi:hypothetical protein